ncbi:MAG: DUF2169 domain-containing protein [Byssovorax sp.]
MLVASLCSLPVGVLRWRGPTPRLTVIVKATYAIARDGEAELAATQLPLSLDLADPHGDASALWYASDFVPRKARADVTLVGGAFADPASALIPVQLLLDGLERRFVARAGAPSPYIPLSESYLHASLARNAATVAVGPRSLAARALGDAAAALDAAGLPAGPLDEGFDHGAFNAAPREQQIAALRADATITLVGATRDGERRTVRLPGHRPRAFHAGAGGPGGTPNEITLTPDTLWIDSFTEIAVVVWRGEIALADLPERPEEILLALEQGPSRWIWPELRATFASARRVRAIEPGDLGAIQIEPNDDAAVEVVDDEVLDARDDEGDELPTDRPPPPPAIEIEIEDEPTPAPRERAAHAIPAEERTGLVDLASLQQARTLPFGPSKRRTQPAAEHTGMVDLAQLRAMQTLPFEQLRALSTATNAEADRPAPDLSATPFDRPSRRNDPLIQTARVDDVARALAPATPFERFAPQPPRDDAPRAALPFALPFAPTRAALPFAPPPPVAHEPESAPRFVPDERFTSSSVISSLAPIEAMPTPTKAAPVATPLLDLETYAKIKAELWQRSPLALPAVAAEHGLTEVEWLTHDLRYIEAIDAQAKDGSSAIAASVARAMAAAKRAGAASDDLDLTDYLALKSEIEAAGTAAMALKKRGLTRRALRRIERRWQPKTTP